MQIVQVEKSVANLVFAVSTNFLKRFIIHCQFNLHYYPTSLIYRVTETRQLFYVLVTCDVDSDCATREVCTNILTRNTACGMYFCAKKFIQSLFCETG